VTLVALVLAAALAACGGPGEPVEPPDGGDRSEPASEEATLGGTEWVLTSLDGNSPVEGSTITLAFHNGDEISGNAGCNYYGARYITSGNDFNISARGIDKTDMDCNVPECVMQQEDAYFEALRNAATYRVMGDRLEIKDTAGETILTFAMKEEPPIDPALDDTEWVLTSLNGSSLREGSNITLNFAGGKVGGFAGCNAYGGEYTAADEGTLTIGEMMITCQLCPSPEGVMQQEDAYTEVLRNAAAYRLLDDHLEIANAAGETTLVFTMKEEFPMDPSDLVGTAWQLVSMDGRSPVEGATITLAFHDENQVSGSAGCREYVATYEASGDDIRFSWIAMMGSICAGPESLLEQEGQYTTSLGWVTNYRLSEEQLEILTARGEVLVFEPLPEDSNASLERTTWVLTAFIEEKTAEGMDIPLLMPTNLLAETAITATFEDGTVSGSAGCNAYSAAYTCDGPFLTFDPPIVTEMACSGPAGIMEQEQRYLGLLNDATAYRIYGSQLWLETGDGRALIFTVQE
jgi:heat shock protein HslJ